MNGSLIARIANGRTDLVFDCPAAGVEAGATDADGVSLVQWCAYYGDVSAIRCLLSHGASLDVLGDNLELNGAAFHGHWRLCQFLIEHGADVNRPLPDSGETPLHSALCKFESRAHEEVVRVLLSAGADPTRTTLAGAETGGFMRDSRTRAETPLHRAAAFGTEPAIQCLLDAGAKRDARDSVGDTPLSWASWHLRSTAVLRLLCYGDYRIRPDYTSMEANLLGDSSA